MLIQRSNFVASITPTTQLNSVNPNKVNRARLKALTDLPNIAKASAGDLVILGYSEPSQLFAQCPFEMYERLCALTAVRHDPCVIDVFMSVTCFMAGQDPQPWWKYTEERKRIVQSKAQAASKRETPDYPLPAS